MADIPHNTRSWLALLAIFIRYGLYRLGIGSCPTFRNNMYDCLVVIGRVMKWRERLRIVGGKHCPNKEPVVFCSNHIKKDDPFVTGAAIFLSSGRGIWVYYMMRDNFFGPGKARLLYDPDELLTMLGARHISREQVTLSQLRVFIDFLKEGKSFLMYPGRSRSRSGLVMEYRDGITEPGGPSFFVAQAQRSRDESIPMVPLARTFNPVKKTTTIAFGEPIYLPDGADRKQQRAADLAVVEAIGELIEMNAAHIIAGIIYLRCLHGVHAPISMSTLQNQVIEVADSLSGRALDPAIRRDTAYEVRATVAYLEDGKMLREVDDYITPWPSHVLASPPLDKSFAEANPIKHLVNQILHLPDVVRALEAVIPHWTNSHSDA